MTNIIYTGKKDNLTAPPPLKYERASKHGTRAYTQNCLHRQKSDGLIFSCVHWRHCDKCQQLIASGTDSDSQVGVELSQKHSMKRLTFGCHFGELSRISIIWVCNKRRVAAESCFVCVRGAIGRFRQPTLGLGDWVNISAVSCSWIISQNSYFWPHLLIAWPWPLTYQSKSLTSSSFYPTWCFCILWDLIQSIVPEI